MELVDDDLDRFRSYIIDNQPGLNMPLWADDKVSLALGSNERMLRPFVGLSCVYDIEFIDSALQKHQRQLMTATQQARPAAAAVAEPVDGKPAITLSVHATDKARVPPLVKNLRERFAIRMISTTDVTQSVALQQRYDELLRGTYRGMRQSSLEGLSKFPRPWSTTHRRMGAPCRSGAWRIRSRGSTST
eukprot:COSAG02_NODE_219_length_28538_cov_79.322058_27_plen_189_part_00